MGEKTHAGIRAMKDQLRHRGPDDSAIFADAHICLAHTRLAIIDLSSLGQQPMTSADGRYVIVFNGEIYNYKRIREQLKDHHFQSSTDTEVILVAYSKWGHKCLELFDGMFSFAIWDTEKRELFISRDRFGVKPLYFAYVNNVFIFASEIRSLLRSGFVKKEISTSGLVDFLSYQTVHGSGTIINGIEMVPAGSYMRVDRHGLSTNIYWSANSALNLSNQNKPYSRVCEDIFALFSDAVASRMVADVEVGAFLSGGIDSSAVVAMMSQLSSGKVQTFNVSFNDRLYDESEYASIIARKFKTQHNEVRLTPEELLQALPRAFDSMDHPSGDGLNTYIISKAVREKGIKVALSGIGGDELFGGYNIFKYSARLTRLSKLPKVRPALKRKMAMAATRLFPRPATVKFGELLSEKSADLISLYSFYRKLYFDNEIAEMMGLDEFRAPHRSEMAKCISPMLSVTGNTTMLELNFYLHDVLLRDIDQMSMAHALEVREPFLDHHLVEYILSIGEEHLRPLTSKRLLIDSFGGLIPEAIYKRKKMGFSLPWDSWLRHELKAFVVEQTDCFCKREILNEKIVRDFVSRFYSGDKTVNWQRVWVFVVLEQWLSSNEIYGSGE